MRRLFQHLEKNFVALDHAKLAASSLLDGLEADFQVPHLRFQRRIAYLEAAIDFALGMNLLVDLAYPEPTAFAEPQGILDEQNERCKHQCEQFHCPF